MSFSLAVKLKNGKSRKLNEKSSKDNQSKKNIQNDYYDVSPKSVFRGYVLGTCM